MKLLSNEQTATLLGVQPKTLESWRWRGFGPGWKKVGRLVRYAEGDVMTWLEAQSRGSTSEGPQTRAAPSHSH